MKCRPHESTGGWLWILFIHSECFYLDVLIFCQRFFFCACSLLNSIRIMPVLEFSIVSFHSILWNIHTKCRIGYFLCILQFIRVPLRIMLRIWIVLPWSRTQRLHLFILISTAFDVCRNRRIYCNHWIIFRFCVVGATNKKIIIESLGIEKHSVI